MKDFLPAQEVKNLKSAHRIEKDRRRADRIKAILLLNEGLSYQQIAKILLLDETTIRRYEKEYKKAWIDGLLENHYHGPIGHLTDSQEIELIDYLENHLHQRAVEIAARIEKTYGVNYSVEGVTSRTNIISY